jgi:hypothetical protein
MMYKAKGRCLFWDPYKTQREASIMWNFFNVKPGGKYRNR